MDFKLSGKLIETLLNSNEQEKNELIWQIIHISQFLLNHENGNAVIRKILEFANNKQIHSIFEKGNGKILDLCLDPHGKKVIQKILEVLLS